jgi:hypothetical protein
MGKIVPISEDIHKTLPSQYLGAALANFQGKVKLVATSYNWDSGPNSFIGRFT